LPSQSSRSVVVRTPAKLNLFLELHGKRPDGYHELETVMVAVNCFDALRIGLTDRHADVRLTSHWWPSANDWKESLGPAADALLNIPNDSSNLIHRAVTETRRALGIDAGFDIVARKRIPAGAGMGGASSDAAAAILGVAALAGVDNDDPRLAKIAASIGSDVPFFLGPRATGFEPSGPCEAAIATGRGEKLAPFSLGQRLWFVVGFPRGGLSTAAVYQRAVVPAQPVRSEECVAALTSGRPGAVQSVLLNRLSHPAQSLSPLVGDLLRMMNDCGLATAMMTGSGSACFGICADRMSALRISNALRHRWSAALGGGRVMVVSSVAVSPRIKGCG
jgi:4-diphosphocytidyl-2-C-methyl-D-erythritol kinase